MKKQNADGWWNTMKENEIEKLKERSLVTKNFSRKWLKILHHFSNTHKALSPIPISDVKNVKDLHLSFGNRRVFFVLYRHALFHGIPIVL